MRIRVVDGERQVEINFKGADPDTLRQAERTARRLAQALSRPEKKRHPLGFGVTADVSGGQARTVSDSELDGDNDGDDE